MKVLILLAIYLHLSWSFRIDMSKHNSNQTQFSIEKLGGGAQESGERYVAESSLTNPVYMCPPGKVLLHNKICVEPSNG
jgi:hypothetical protein